MLAGIAGEDDATITEAGKLKQLYHVIQAHPPGLIQNHDRAPGNLGAGIGIGTVAVIGGVAAAATVGGLAAVGDLPGQSGASPPASR